MNNNMKKILIYTVLALGAMMSVSCENSIMNPEQAEERPIFLKGTEISNVEELINTIKSTMDNCKKAQEQLSGFVDELNDKVGKAADSDTQIASLLKNLDSKCSEMEKQVNTARESADKGSKDLMKWISDTYATKDVLSALQNTTSEINTSINTIMSRIEKLDSDMAKIAKDLESSKKNIDGTLGKCQTDLSGIMDRIDKLEGRADKLEKEISAIVGSVQSIVVVPDYSDGSVMVSDAVNNKIYFDVLPLSAAEKIASIGTGCLSLDAVETITKSSEIIPFKLSVSQVGFDGQYLYVIADGTSLSSDIKSGLKGVNARLRISTENTTRSSEYFQLNYGKQTKEGSISATVSKAYELSVIFSGTTDIFSTDPNEDVKYGIVFSSKTDDIYYNNTICDTLNVKVAADGSFTKLCTNEYGRIASCTHYQYRPYACINGKFIYGEKGEFTTPSSYEGVSYDVNDITYEGGDVTIKAKISPKDPSMTIDENYVDVYVNADSLALIYFSGTYYSTVVDSEGNLTVNIPNCDLTRKVYYRIAGNALLDGSYVGRSESSIYSIDLEYPEYVDLGLSVKWATCDLGAYRPVAMGDSFKWSMNDYYDSSTDTFTKYNSTDGKTILEPIDDNATQILGPEWHTPTVAEWEELFNPENTEIVQLNRTAENPPYFPWHYYKITSRKPGYTDKSIYLFTNIGTWDWEFWTSDIYSSDYHNSLSFRLNFYSAVGSYYTNYRDRTSSATFIRPVRK